jgi:hypothetical protein
MIAHAGAESRRLRSDKELRAIILVSNRWGKRVNPFGRDWLVVPGGGWGQFRAHAPAPACLGWRCQTSQATRQTVPNPSALFPLDRRGPQLFPGSEDSCWVESAARCEDNRSSDCQPLAAQPGRSLPPRRLKAQSPLSPPEREERVKRLDVSLRGPLCWRERQWLPCPRPKHKARFVFPW